MRAKVEHAFRVIKRQSGHVKVRYRGLNKNTVQLRALFALSNLWVAHKTRQPLDAHLPVTCADLPCRLLSAAWFSLACVHRAWRFGLRRSIHEQSALLGEPERVR